MNPLLVSIVKNAFTKDNITKSPTTIVATIAGSIAAASASQGFTLTNYSSEHEMWVALGAAILSAILFFFKDRWTKK